jgi:uncharacterized membrane protein
LVVGYPVLAHYTNESADNRLLGALVALAPLVLIALVLAWRSPQRVILLPLLGLSCVALWVAWPALEHHFGVIYWLQHAGMQLILFVVFGRTLLGGRLPLCTRFARVVHAPIILTPRHERYTRQVTLAWTVFFAVMALTSTALFFWAPLATWSVFANFLTLPLIVLMFVAEYRIRHWALPHVPPTHILDAVRAFRDSAGHPR